jgi:hypothetical protein
MMMTDGKPSAENPAKGELEKMIRRLAPEISRIFGRYNASEMEARRVLGETLAGFSRKWGRLVNRERWLLRNLETALRHGRQEQRE